LMDGREAAFERLGNQPAEESATALAERLLCRVRALESKEPCGDVVDYNALLQQLDERRARAGEQIFCLAVDSLGAADSLAAARAREPLEQRDWELLAPLLSMEPDELKQHVVRPAHGSAARS
jgi:hypothetical protein